MAEEADKRDMLLDSSKEYLVEIYRDETMENSRLRTLLLGLAARPEVTAETRQWLAAQLRDKTQIKVVHGLREDEMEGVEDVVKWATKLVDQVREVTELKTGDKPDLAWYHKAEAFSNQLSGALQELSQQLGLTLKDLEDPTSR